MDALGPDPEGLADLLDVELGAASVLEQQRRGMAGVGERQLSRPGVVDEVLARDDGRDADVLAAVVLLGGGDDPRPLVEPGEDLRGWLVVLGEGPQRGPELAHDGGGLGPRPSTSPMTMPTRPADSGMTSYQSPPTCVWMPCPCEASGAAG